jgi:serine protease AprX
MTVAAYSAETGDSGHGFCEKTAPVRAYDHAVQRCERPVFRLKSALLVCLLAAGARPSLGADAGALDRVFAGKGPGETASLLVVLRDQADLSGSATLSGPDRRRFVYEALRSTADASQAGLRRRLAQAGVRFHSFFLVNMIEVESSRALAEELALRDDVALVAANRPARFAGPRPPEAAISPASETAIEASLELVEAPSVWDLGFTGQGVVVGVADTGMDWEHPALKGRYRGFDGTSASHSYNWHDSIHDPSPGNPCGSDSPAPCDDDTHGTHVTGTAVGSDGGENLIGMAPAARWIGCRNMDRGVGTPARYTECFQFFLAPTDSAGANPRPELGADVTSNSWGCPPSEGCTDPDVLRAVFENVRAAGIFVAVAAGNSGPSCSTIDTVPGFYDAAFSVGASSIVDTIAGFSSRGPVTVDGSNRVKPDVVAPGVAIRSSIPGSAYARYSGTSMATPHVAGAVALLWSAAPALANHVPETEALLRATAVHLTSAEECGGVSGSAVPNPVFGWGRIDIAAAVAAARASEGPPTPPAPRFRVTRPRPGSKAIAPRH